MRRIVAYATLLFIALGLVQRFAPGQDPQLPPRAQPPEWDPAQTDGIFFDNAFEEGLIGPRPSNFGEAVVSPSSPGTQPPPSGSSGGIYTWSETISPTSLEDYVKSMKLLVDGSISSPSRFAGQDYRNARRNFSMLAMLFAVVAEYDGDVRWQEYAATARDQFSRSAANAKVGTIQVFQEARLRKEELQLLVGGDAIELRPQSEAAANWGDVCDRGPLMQWMEIVFQEKLLPWTGSESEFNAHKEDLVREAEIMAMMATILSKEGMKDADDDTYAEFCDMMKEASLDIISAVQLNNQQQAQSAAGVITTSCSDCHDFYRE